MTKIIIKTKPKDSSKVAENKKTPVKADGRAGSFPVPIRIKKA